MPPGFEADHPVQIGQIELAGPDRGAGGRGDEVTIVATFASASRAEARFNEQQKPDDPDSIHGARSPCRRRSGNSALDAQACSDLKDSFFHLD